MQYQKNYDVKLYLHWVNLCLLVLPPTSVPKNKSRPNKLWCKIIPPLGKFMLPNKLWCKIYVNLCYQIIYDVKFILHCVNLRSITTYYWGWNINLLLKSRKLANRVNRSIQLQPLRCVRIGINMYKYKSISPQLTQHHGRHGTDTICRCYFQEPIRISGSIDSDPGGKAPTCLRWTRIRCKKLDLPQRGTNHQVGETSPVHAQWARSTESSQC